ncbi:hypothetical protein K501DRAFT_311301 [Backusella circina FSU 941]|nr:hypothetical protein K501DRAFT_311301 [Backusella circina FSU 941]
MKFLYISTLAVLFATLSSAQDIVNGVDEVSQVTDAAAAIESYEDLETVDNISISVVNGEDGSFGIVKHGGDDLVRVIKTKSGHLTTEYFTVINVDVKSKSEDNQSDEEASARNEEVFEKYFAGLEELDFEDLN